MLPPLWHGGPEYAERTPRVGDTIPPGVPLYDLLPHYGAHYPPFPRGDDDYRRGGSLGSRGRASLSLQFVR